MKRSIIALGICASILSSCVLEKSGKSQHNPDIMENYTRSMFRYNVLVPAAHINALVMLDEYIAASEEEKMSEAFEWHRSNIFHEDDNTYFIKDFGSVKTRGMRLREADPCWEAGYEFEYDQVALNSWKVTLTGYGAPVSTTVTFTGKDSEGRNRFSVDAYNTQKADVSEYNDKTVSATVFTPEGGMTIINPLPQVDLYYADTPEGSGTFRIETFTDSEQLDWMELSYSKNGKSLMFNCNLMSPIYY